jgi:hypothetical protein
MAHHRAAWVSVVVAGFWPAGAACAAERTALALTESDSRHFSSSSVSARSEVRPGAAKRYSFSMLAPADRDARALPAPSAAPDLYRYSQDSTGAPDPRAEEGAYGLSDRAALEPLRIASPSLMNRTGWSWSGRLGPLRWLGPVDGEPGEFMLRLRRIPGQPRIEGVGRFHIGIHYTFE